MNVRPSKPCLLAFAMLAAALAFPAVAGVPPQHREGDDSKVSLRLRMQVASTLKDTVQTYFAHWQGVPNLDFQARFQHYLDEIAATDDRKSFDRSTVAMMAALGNAHTSFGDAWLGKVSGNPVGLTVAYRDQAWVVVQSQRPAVPQGAVVTALDGVPIDDFYRANGKYVSASDDISRRDRLFGVRWIFPTRFTVAFADGSKAVVDRSVPVPSAVGPALAPSMPDGVAYARITSFSEARFEDDAVAFVRSHADARAIILDVRGNDGGSTPATLLDALVTEPYTDWTELSAMSVGMLKTYGAMVDTPAAKDPEFHGFAEALDNYFRQPMLYFPGTVQKPGKPLYRGKLVVLADTGCVSACEDFLMPLKVTHRAVIVGERTNGSSGQPKVVDFGNGMILRVGAKRMVFGDGSPFEGVGIGPDVPVTATPAQLRDHQDPALKKAIDIALAGESARSGSSH